MPDPPNAPAGALFGWRVLEISHGVPACFCAKILGDLGAEVVQVEPPDGHPVRREGPRRPGSPTSATSGRFAYLSTGKSSVVVPDGPGRLDAIRRLAVGCDVLVTDEPSWYADNGLDAATSVVVITPFGLTGPYAGFRADHLVCFHAGGEGSLLPSGMGWQQFPERAPIPAGSEIGHYDAGWNAAIAALAAMHDRRRTGLGQRVDLSEQESELTLNRTRLSRFNNDGVAMHREAGRYGFLGMMQCCDGWVQLVGMTPDQWDALATSSDAGELADPRVARAASRSENQELAGAAIQSWCRQRPKAEVVRILAALGAPVGSYAMPSDLLASEQLAHRGFFRRVDDGAGGQIFVPGPPYRFSATPIEIRSAPALGNTQGFVSVDSAKSELAPGRALEGIRILDFTWAAAGPYATCLLGLLGAEVIKIESTRRPDPARRGFLADYGGLNRSPNFNELNLNKRSFQVDLSQPRGLALVHRLVASADVVVDNFRPGVMAKFGLDAATLLTQRPGLVVASSSANGATGPEARAAGLASIFGATGGLSEQTGYADGPPTEVGESTDYRSGAALAVAILAALLHRHRTGQGQHVDLASREVVVASAPDAVLAQQLGSDWPIRVGDGHRVHAPYGVYPTEQSDDWLAVAIVDDAAWRALCTVLQREEWIAGYPTAGSRRAADPIITAAITAWTTTRSSRAGFEELQAAGVPAGPVMTNEMLARDPHVRARDVFIDVTHPEIGPVQVMRQPWLFSDLDFDVRPGPLIGQDNHYVLEMVLGLSEQERDEVRAVLR
jgi:crotonobetainyl-CoA:carnitine CoA-transferase CaiB-like acyl-CoA transferase